jgi:hypothetical protein
LPCRLPIGDDPFNRKTSAQPATTGLFRASMLNFMLRGVAALFLLLEINVIYCAMLHAESGAIGRREIS